MELSAKINENIFKEFSMESLRSEGILAEVNRRFFHTMGLSMIIEENEDGSLKIKIIENADDSFGFEYNIKNALPRRKNRFKNYKKMVDERINRFKEKRKEYYGGYITEQVL